MFVFVVSDGAKEEQGDVASTARVSCDPGAAVRGTKETAGTHNQRRDKKQVCSRLSLLVASLSDLPDPPIKRKIFHFYGVLFFNLSPFRFILKFFHFSRTLLAIANNIYRHI